MDIVEREQALRAVTERIRSKRPDHPPPVLEQAHALTFPFILAGTLLLGSVLAWAFVALHPVESTVSSELSTSVVSTIDPVALAWAGVLSLGAVLSGLWVLLQVVTVRLRP